MEKDIKFCKMYENALLSIVKGSINTFVCAFQ